MLNLQRRVDPGAVGDGFREEPGVPDAGVPLRGEGALHHHRRLAPRLTHGGPGRDCNLLGPYSSLFY